LGSLLLAQHAPLPSACSPQGQAALVGTTATPSSSTHLRLSIARLRSTDDDCPTDVGLASCACLVWRLSLALHSSATSTSSRLSLAPPRRLRHTAKVTLAQLLPSSSSSFRLDSPRRSSAPHSRPVNRGAAWPPCRAPMSTPSTSTATSQAQGHSHSHKHAHRHRALSLGAARSRDEARLGITTDYKDLSLHSAAANGNLGEPQLR